MVFDREIAGGPATSPTLDLSNGQTDRLGRLLVSQAGLFMKQQRKPKALHDLNRHGSSANGVECLLHEIVREGTTSGLGPGIAASFPCRAFLGVTSLYQRSDVTTTLFVKRTTKGVPFADRAFVLIANRLIRPASEHRLAGWLETDFLCDRRGRRFVPHWHQHQRVRVHFQQLEAWYRTMDQLVAATEKIEVALYHRLRDLFSFKPDLVLYDITSTYFEGAGPAGFAKHGHSRDGKPHNVQVIVAVVMVAGWPIAHHVWAGNEVDHTTVGKAIADLHRRFGFNRLVFVGDRGMVTSNNLDAITAGNHGYLVGLKRRRNKRLDKWLAAVDEAKWINCPVGFTAREKADPPRTRAQEVPSGIAGMRVIIVDSDERRAYEEAMRVEVDGADAPGVGETAAAHGGRQAEATREDRRRGRAAAAAEPRLPLLLLGDPSGGLPVLRERGRPGERERDRV